MWELRLGDKVLRYATYAELKAKHSFGVRKFAKWRP